MRTVAALITAPIAGLITSLTATAAGAQPPDTTRVVEGTVFDSLLTMRPLAGAEVWVEGTALVARTDSAGRFAVRGVEPGRRRVAVSHPSLDALGVTGPVAEVTVGAGAPAALMLATPAAATVYARLCGAPAAPGVSVVAGVVQGLDGAPAAGALVWARGAGGGGAGPAPRARADAEGRFRICGVAALSLALFAADTLGDGRARLGVTPVVTNGRPIAVATVRLPAVDAAPPRRTVVGSVLTPDGLPVREASVEVEGAGAARTDATGRFSLALPDGPAGSAYPLAVRAVGFRAEALRVDATTAGLAVALTPAAPTLERVLTRAAPSLDLVGFEARRTSGNGGRFITAADIEKQNPVKLSQVLHTIPGVVLTRDAARTVLPELRVSSQRSQGGSPLRPEGCQVNVFVDGTYVSDAMGPGGLDATIFPRDILGIEVYLGFANVPPKFQRTTSGCGTVLIWTKRETAP